MLDCVFEDPAVDVLERGGGVFDGEEGGDLGEEADPVGCEEVKAVLDDALGVLWRIRGPEGVADPLEAVELGRDTGVWGLGRCFLFMVVPGMRERGCAEQDQDQDCEKSEIGINWVHGIGGAYSRLCLGSSCIS